MFRLHLMLIVGMLVLATGVAAQEGEVLTPTSETPATATVTPEPVVTPDEIATFSVAWMDTLVQRVSAEAISPPVASRIYAYAGVTLYEAVQPSNGVYHTLAGRLHEMPAMPAPQSGAAYDWPLVLTGAMGTLAPGLFEANNPETQAAFEALAAEQAATRGEVVTFNTYNRSLAHGAELGEAVLAWAATDNYPHLDALHYTLPTGSPALWEPLPGQMPLEPHWSILRPFVMPMASACAVPLGISYSEAPGSLFYQQVDTVRAAVTNATDEERLIAYFWADNPGGTHGTPPGHWILIQGELVTQLELNGMETVRMFALVNVAMGDAFISAWEGKYSVPLVRPVTVIRRRIDPTWEPVVTTPPFPEYPSGHSVVSAAAAAVLTGLYGADVGFINTGTVGGQPVTRTYPSFQAAAEEAAMSRLYGGIHYPVGIQNGLQQGACVGNYVVENLVMGGL